LWMPRETDLTPEQLARRRQLNRFIGHKDIDLLGGHHWNLPVAGPATANSRIFVGSPAGQMLREIGEGSISRKELLKHLMFGAPLKTAPAPQDDTLYRTVVAHEGAEKAMLDAAERKEIPARFTASHIGGIPIVAEQLAAFRDPDAQRTLYRIRERHPDDAFIMRKIRQFGGRLDSPLAIGSRQHAALERELARYTPEASPAMNNRIRMAVKKKSHGLRYTPDHPVWGLVDALPEAGEWVRRHSFGLFPSAPQRAQQLAQYIAGRIAPDVADPKNLADLLKLLPSRVRR
jgi:hypothetical protein